MQCITCKQPLTGQVGTVRFNCPRCMKRELVRCAHCRKIAAKYVCAECNFEGPN